MSATIAHRAIDDPFFEGRRLTGHLLQFPSLIHPSVYPEEYVVANILLHRVRIPSDNSPG